MENRIRRRLDAASRLTFFSYAASTVILPVSLVAIKTELGLSLTQAGTLSLVSSIVIFAILLASVPAAAAVGKIRLLRGALWILAGGLLVFTQVNSFVFAIVGIIIIAFGQAVPEALLTPLVEDVHPGDDGSNQLLFQAAWPVGVIFGTLVFGEGLSRGISWRYAFLFVAVLCVFVGALYPHRRRANLPRSRADFSHVGEVFSEPLFWIMAVALFASGGVEGAFAFWTASYIQLEFGTMARAGGLGVAVFAFGMALGRFLSSRLMVQFGLKRLLLVCAAAALLFSTGFFIVGKLLPLYFLMIVIGFAVAPMWPAVQTYTVRRLGRADPTMVMAFLSCFGILGYSGGTFLMGLIGDGFGLRMSFLVAPAMALLLLLLILFEGTRKTTRFDVA